MTERFERDWLALREGFDHAARSVALARRLANALPARRPLLVDLAAGTGSLFRYLAPIIGRGQDWLLVDADGALLDDAFGRTAAWARRLGFAATAQGDELLVSSRYGLWRMRAMQQEISQLPTASEERATCTPLPLAGEVGAQRRVRVQRPNKDPHPRRFAPRPPPQAVEACDVRAPMFPEADAVLCSALLDLVSQRWLQHLVDSLRTPFLACLTVDGRDTWRPLHSTDGIVHAAFRRDQRRDKGFGPALGITAPSATLRGLAARGFATLSAPSDWHISRTALRMQRALIEGTADAARNAAPARNAAITAWEAMRLRQAMRARLAIRIGHRDILALPRGG